MNDNEREILCRKLAHLINDYRESYEAEYFHFYQGFMLCMKTLGYYVEFTFDMDALIDGFICNGKTYKLSDF